MAKNEYKEPEIIEDDDVDDDMPSAPKKRGPVLRGIRSVFDGTILAKDSVIKGLPFIFYIAFLAVMYIGNSFYAEKKIMQIEKMKKEIKELRSESISVKSNLMFISKQSEVIKRLGNSGVKESLNPPYKIFVKPDTSTTAKK